MPCPLRTRSPDCGAQAVDSPALLVTALSLVIDNFRHTVLRIRGGPVAAPAES